MKRVLTEVPLGKIKKFIEKEFKNISFSKEATDFFENNFLGDIESLDELIHLKDGIPTNVMDWLKSEFNIELDLNGDYAIATVIALSLEFEKKAIFETQKTNDNLEFASGIHEHCHKYVKKDKNVEYNIVQLNLKNNDYDIYVSKKEIPLSFMDHPIHFKKFIKINEVSLHLPLVKYETKEDISHLFEGSNMIKKSNLKEHSISKVVTYAKVDLGLDKVEVKQAAAVCMVMASLAPIKMIKEHFIINDDFYFYVRAKNRLLFASKMNIGDFIQGEELLKLKEKENEKKPDINNDLNNLNSFGVI